MNYIKLINQFWQLRRSKRITNLQADLYFFLVQECNQRDWENPFECSNKIIIAGIDVAMSSLQDARNRLQQLGLIEFKAGQKNQANPVYFITECIADNRQYLRNSGGDTSGNTSGTAPVIPPEHISTKQNVNKTKQKPKPFSGDAAPAKKKKLPGEKNIYWKAFVETFEKFYMEKNGNNKYEYLGQDWPALDKIYNFLKKRAEQGKFQFNEENLLLAFNFFLEKAWAKDNWLKNNFSISNLLSQINQIANGQSANQNGKQPTGAAVSTGSILAKIDAMPN